MSALALNGNIPYLPRRGLKLPEWLLRPLKMFDGQFYPYQPVQFMDGLLNPIIGGGSAPPAVVQRVTGNNGASRTTSSNVTFSATVAGDLIVIEFLCETNAASPSLPTGYTGWGQGNLSNGGNLTTTIWYKIATSGETGVTVSHGNNQTAWVVREWSAPLQTIEFATAVNATTLTPDPPAITPAAGNGNYGIAAGAMHPASSSISSFSSGYSNGLTSAAGSPLLAPIESCERIISGTTENPGVITLTGTAGKTNAYTYAVS